MSSGYRQKALRVRSMADWSMYGQKILLPPKEIVASQDGSDGSDKTKTQIAVR